MCTPQTSRDLGTDRSSIGAEKLLQPEKASHILKYTEWNFN